MSGWAHAAATPITECDPEALLAEAVAFHGHLCPGQVLGVRMTVAGCRELGLLRPREAGKRLVVFVEIDRCATDAVEVLTGVSLGKGTLRHVDLGKTAATFLDATHRAAVRVAVRDEARALATRYAPGVAEPRRAQTLAYRLMPEPELLRIERVVVDPGRLERPRARVVCAGCGESVTYGRGVRRGGHDLCRACAGEGYYLRLATPP